MKKKLTLKHIIVIVLFGLFVLKFVNQGITLKRIEAEILDRQQELALMQEENLKLEAELNMAKDDPEAYLEKLARERLNMIKPGEQVVNSKDKEQKKPEQ